MDVEDVAAAEDAFFRRLVMLIDRGAFAAGGRYREIREEIVIRY